MGGHRQTHAGGPGFGQSLARVLAQSMGHFVPHDHGHFIVVQLQLIQDAGVERNLSTGHAPSIDLFAANEVDFPFPLARIGVPLSCERNQFGGDGTQAFELGVVVWGQGPFAFGFP